MGEFEENPVWAVVDAYLVGELIPAVGRLKG
jgi:hypothetical protein